MKKFVAIAVLLGSMLAWPTAAQQRRPPVIDMHVHSTNTSPQQALDRMKALNIRYLFVSSLTADLPKWANAFDASQFLPALVLPCDRGLAPITGRSCYDHPTEFPDLAWLRREIGAGRIRAFGEVEPQYLRMSPADPRMDATWALAEEFDLPVGIHMGPGPAGIAYDASKMPFKSPAFRVALGDRCCLRKCWFVTSGCAST